MIDPETQHALWLTLKLASTTTFILLLVALPLSWWLTHSPSRWRFAISTLVTMPLVLPPTVIGFYLLLALGPNGPIGGLTQALGLGSLAFSFTGLLIGSIVYSLPFAVQPLQQSFESIGRQPVEIAATLNASPLDSFFTVILPLARPGIVCAIVLTFAHTVGEFGVVLMIGGNIPGLTQVISTQIFGHVEAMEYYQAHWLSAGMLAFSFLVLLMLSLINRQQFFFRFQRKEK